MNAGKGSLLLLAVLSFPVFGNDFSIDDIRAAAAEIRAVRDAQDFILSNIAARDARDPRGVLEEMADRITQAMQHADVPLADAKQYILLVKQHGFPAYLQ